MPKTLNLTTEAIREESRVQRLPAVLPLSAINVFSRQMRETYQGLDELADSIREQTQLESGIAAALSPRQAGRFVRDLNDLWGTNLHLDQCVRVTIDGTYYYIFLVAGHRRYYACRIVEKEYQPGLKYRIDLRFNMKAEEALSIQFAENTHVRVPPHEEARAIALAWRWRKKRDDSLTRAQFARSLNRSDTWVAGALRFVDLPEHIQECVDDGRLSYGVVLQLARLISGLESLDQPITEGELEHWITTSIVHRHREPEVRALVTKRLFDATYEQTTLFGDGFVDTRPIRRVVAEGMVHGLLDFLGYLETLQKHRMAGGFRDESYFDPEVDPEHRDSYSLGSPLRLLSRSLSYLESELPHFEELARKHGGRHRPALARGRQLLPRVERAVARLEKRESSS